MMASAEMPWDESGVKVLLPPRRMENILMLPLRKLLILRPAELLLRCPERSVTRFLLLSWEASRRLRESFRLRVGTSAIILAAEMNG
jgi:hypothetical protein